MSITRKGARTAIKLLVDKVNIAKKTTTYAKRISTTAADVEISVEIAYADKVLWSWIKPISVNMAARKPAERLNLGHANASSVGVPVNRFQSLWRTKSMVLLILQSRNWTQGGCEIDDERQNQHKKTVEIRPNEHFRLVQWDKVSKAASIFYRNRQVSAFWRQEMR